MLGPFLFALALLLAECPWLARDTCPQEEREARRRAQLEMDEHIRQYQVGLLRQLSIAIAPLLHVRALASLGNDHNRSRGPAMCPGACLCPNARGTALRFSS